MRELVFDRGLPAAPDEEEIILGAILVDPAALAIAGSALRAGDFSVESNRRIFAVMLLLNQEGIGVDRVTIRRRLQDIGQLTSLGPGYLDSLDTNMPRIVNLENYISTVKEKSLKRQLILQAQSIIDRALMDNEPAAAVLKGAESSILALDEGGRSGDMLDPLQVMEAYPGGYSAFLDPSKHAKGLKTGFHRLDEMTAGLYPGDLVILAGRPGMGKSALAMNIVANVAGYAKPPRTVAVFSIEMSNEQLLMRMICAEARVNIQRFRLGYLNKEERTRVQAASALISNWPVPMTDRSSMTVFDMLARGRRLKENRDLALIVIDYIQLMGGQGENRNQEVSGISRGLKLMAKDLQVPVLALAQLNRAVDTRVSGNHRAQLSDLRESGSLEQDADMVWFAFRPEWYKPHDEELKGQAEVNIAKQRNGPTGTVQLLFKKEYARFENLARDCEKEPEE